jgi:hypothetical protein
VQRVHAGVLILQYQVQNPPPAAHRRVDGEGAGHAAERQWVGGCSTAQALSRETFEG